MRKSIVRSVQGILVAFCCLLTVSGSAGAVQNGGIGGRPANPDPNNPRTESIFIYTIDRGATKTDQVLVSNNSESTKRIKLSAVDGVVTNTGAYTCRQTAEALQDLGGWIKLDSQEVTLTPGQSQKIGFSITMPANADVGEHDACLTFEDADDTGVAQGGVRVHTRQAIRVVATVPGDLHREITIASFSAMSQGQNQRYSLTLSNKGNVSADVDTHVVLKDMFGHVLSDNGGSYPVLSDKKLDLQFEASARPFFGGWYTAYATISYDKTAGTFGVSADKRYMVTQQSKGQVIFVPPTALGWVTIAVIFLGLGAIVVWFVRRRRLQNIVKREWVQYTVDKDQTLEGLASEVGVSWQKLARYNALKAPYTLAPGQEIRLPRKEAEDGRSGTDEKTRR